MRIVLPIVKFGTKTIELGGRQRVDTSGQKNRLIKFGMPLSVFLLVSLVGIFIWRKLSAPSYGQVAVVSPYTSPVTKLADYTTLSTSYYSLNYSKRFSRQPADIAPAGILDRQQLVYNQPNGSLSSRVQIDIKAAPLGGITQDSVYMYYQKRPNQYNLSNALYRGEIVDIAKNSRGGPEVVAMWLHGSWLMIIRSTSTDKSEPLSSEMKGMLSSLQWREQ